MSYQELHENWQKFSVLIDTVSKNNDEQMNMLINRYIEQNAIILNEILTTSIKNLKTLQKEARTPNDVICLQARFTHEINKKMSLAAQRFLNASLGHIADYNEWLKSHCDLATD